MDKLINTLSQYLSQSSNMLGSEVCVQLELMYLVLLFQLVGAAFGAAGQRCMALTTAIFVGESKEWIPDLVAKAKELQVNEGTVSF